MSIRLTDLQAKRLDQLKTVNYFTGKRSEYAFTVVGRPDEIPKLDADTVFIHLSFRPTVMNILMLLDTCPRLKMIQATHCVIYSLSDTAINTLKLGGVELIEGTIQFMNRKRPIIV